MFDFLKRKAFEKAARSTASKEVATLKKLARHDQVKVSLFVLQFISETEELRRKVRNTDMLAANVIGFAAALREAKINSGAHQHDPDWLKFALVESWCTSLSSKFDAPYRMEIDVMVRGAVLAVGATSFPRSDKILPDELVNFVLSH